MQRLMARATSRRGCKPCWQNRAALTEAQKALLSPAAGDTTLAPPAARAAFDAADARRAATPANTKERAAAAATAMRLTAQIAWAAFDAGDFNEAATWFARRATLKKESYANAKAFYLARFKATRQEFYDLLNNLKQHPQAAPGTAILAQSLLDLQAGQMSLIQSLSQANNDYQTRLQSSRLVLILRHAQVDFLTAIKAPETQLLDAGGKVASAVEDIADAQVNLALFSQARGLYDQALALRRALPVTAPGHALDSPLSDLGLLYQKWAT